LYFFKLLDNISPSGNPTTKMQITPGITPQFNSRTRNVEHFISKWEKGDHPDLYKLEEKTWAPWMRKPQKNFAIITKIFPNGQRKITNKSGQIVAMFSTNRINWDGDTESLPTWDLVAGGSIEQGNFSSTYISYGNTLDIMSISVDPDMQGKGLATILFNELINIAQELEVEHLIASFRPCGFGSFKVKSGLIAFDEYCKITTEDGLPRDPWLRIATRYGMVPLRIERSAISVEVSLKQFEEWKETYNPENWTQNEKDQWECGEAGVWTIKGNKAKYVEPNLWGEIPIR
jgi:GNAT superfamily N-acetyltransferase